MHGVAMRLVVLGVVVLWACGDEVGEGGPSDAQEVAADTVSGVDAAEVIQAADGIDLPDAAPDSVARDGTEDGASPPETSPVVPWPGFGLISGACGVLDDELTAPMPSLFVNHIDFGDDPYDAGDIDRLTDGGREILADGNAGGSSILSEVFAYEMLARCEGARLLKTENEIVYDVQSKITDMIVLIDDLKIGANPTRAIGFPFDAPYTVEQAVTVLEKKLGDINSSTAAVSEADRWVKQILTVFAYAEGHVAAVETAWSRIDPALRGDTIVIITVTDGEDRFIYSDE
jgi:hypothetical protein